MTQKPIVGRTINYNGKLYFLRKNGEYGNGKEILPQCIVKKLEEKQQNQR